MTLALEAHNLNHWPTREVPVGWILHKTVKKDKVELSLSSEVKGQGSHAKFRGKNKPWARELALHKQQEGQGEGGMKRRSKMGGNMLGRVM